mmetsp:Transcript_27648/g.74828  ORF Transcript_27648/g.74828 Transcript_27648/m.74828 type:complete len:201 (-) Transcript_27648:1791-2393(-)
MRKSHACSQLPWFKTNAGPEHRKISASVACITTLEVSRHRQALSASEVSLLSTSALDSGCSTFSFRRVSSSAWLPSAMPDASLRTPSSTMPKPQPTILTDFTAARQEFPCTDMAAYGQASKKHWTICVTTAVPLTAMAASFGLEPHKCRWQSSNLSCPWHCTTPPPGSKDSAQSHMDTTDSHSRNSCRSVASSGCSCFIS